MILVEDARSEAVSVIFPGLTGVIGCSNISSDVLELRIV